MTPELTEEADDVRSSTGTSSTLGSSGPGLEDGRNRYQLDTRVLQLISIVPVHTLPPSVAAESIAFKEHSRLADIFLYPSFKP